MRLFSDPGRLGDVLGIGLDRLWGMRKSQKILQQNLENCLAHKWSGSSRFNAEFAEAWKISPAGVYLKWSCRV